MTEGVRGYNVVVDFWEWYRRREARLNPLASYALEQCEETFRKCDWQPHNLAIVAAIEAKDAVVFLSLNDLGPKFVGPIFLSREWPRNRPA
jgi:hypothetical protein